MERYRTALRLGGIFLFALAVRLIALRLSFDPENLFGKYWALGAELRASHLIADRPFSYAPIYCYFVALGQMFLGDSPHRVLVLQALVGAVNCVLIHQIARRLLGDGWAWLPTLLACTYRSFVLYDVTLLSDGLGLSFQLALLVVLGRLEPTDGWPRYGWAGLWIGLSALHRPNNLLLLPIVLLLLAARDGRPRGWFRHAVVLSGIAIVSTFPIVLQNLRLTGTPGITASNPGYIFYSSNNAASYGFRYSPPELFYRGAEYYRKLEATRPDARFLGDAEIATIISGAIVGHPMSLSESSRYYLDFTLKHIRRYPGYYVSLTLRKLWLAFHGYESHDIAPVFARQERIAPVAPIRFAFVVPLGLLGLALSSRRWNKAVGLWAVLLNNLALLVLFYVVVRFRLPLEAVLIVAAGIAAKELWTWVSERRMKPLAAAALTLAVLYVGCNVLPADLAERARYRDLEVRLEDAGRLMREGRPEEAARVLERLIEEDEEDLPRGLSAHRLLAQIYAATGTVPERSAMKSPTYFEPQEVARRLAAKLERGTITFAELRYLAFLYRSQGETTREQSVLREALRRRAPEPLSRYELARSELASGQAEAAKADLLQAMRDGLLFTTRGIQGSVALADLFRREGDGDAAAAWTEQAVRLSVLVPWYPDEAETRELVDRLRQSPGYEAPPSLERLVPLPGGLTP